MDGEKVEGDKEIVELAARLIAVILTKKVIAIVAILLFVGTAITSGGTNVLQSIDLRNQPVPVEVTSPQMKAVVEESLAPVKAMMADHADEFAHPPAVREFEDIDARFIRQDLRSDRIQAHLEDTAEIVSRVAAQVEMLVQFETSRLGVPR